MKQQPRAESQEPPHGFHRDVYNVHVKTSGAAVPVAGPATWVWLQSCLLVNVVEIDEGKIEAGAKLVDQRHKTALTLCFTGS